MYFQSTLIFPSWTPRVRVPSPLTCGHTAEVTSPACSRLRRGNPTRGTGAKQENGFFHLSRIGRSRHSCRGCGARTWRFSVFRWVLLSRPVADDWARLGRGRSANGHAPGMWQRTKRATCEAEEYHPKYHPSRFALTSLFLWSHPPGLNRRPADYESSSYDESIIYTE